MQDTSFDYTLDERQRQMLEAMGIKLWLPEAEHATAQAPNEAPAAQTSLKPAKTPSSQAFSEEKQALAGISTEPSAMKNVVFADQILEPSSRAPTTIPLAPRPAGIEQMDWPALQDAVTGCQACALCQSRKNAVFGVGQTPSVAALAPQADWLIIGDPPDADEDAQSEPFAGQAGKLLDNMLFAMKMSVSQDGKAVGLSRQRGVYITNVLKCRPPANRNPSPEELATCAPYLARQIELVRPKIILAMGKFAVSALIGSSEPVGKLRGRVHQLQHPSYQAPVIVTYHPAYLLRTPADKAKAWADLLLAMQTYTSLQATFSI